MFELRWFQKEGSRSTTKAPVLQFRTQSRTVSGSGVAGIAFLEWSEWQDVPLTLADGAINGEMIAPISTVSDAAILQDMAYRLARIAEHWGMLASSTDHSRFQFLHEQIRLGNDLSASYYNRRPKPEPAPVAPPKDGESPAIAGLKQFYAAETLEQLILAQDRHIERLQAKLPTMRDPFTPTPVRAG